MLPASLARLAASGAATFTRRMSWHNVPRLVALLVAIVSATTVGAQSDPFMGSPEARPRHLKTLVAMRASAIDAAFPGFLVVADLKVEVAHRTSCSNETTQHACYDANRNALMFDREVLAFVDYRALEVAENYWLFYEYVDLRDRFPIIGLIDNALWGATMSKIAQQHDTTWPHEGCESVQLTKRLGCEMLISAIDSQVRLKRSRIYNANRKDRLWPDDLSFLERSRSGSRDREYADVRDLGGVELLRPLIEEFGAARVFVYVAQTPFSIENSNVRASALRYQERARSALEW